MNGTTALVPLASEINAEHEAACQAVQSALDKGGLGVSSGGGVRFSLERGKTKGVTAMTAIEFDVFESVASGLDAS